MNKLNKEKQHVISKLTSLLVPKLNTNSISNTENWLHTQQQETAFFEIEYQLKNKSEALLEKNSYLSVEHCGTYRCTSCQKVVKKFYNGFCYICLTKKAMADWCVLNPYLCHFPQGTCREPEWGLSFCYQPHYVYLSYTDKFKVGITRKNQIFTRWVDQGATMAAVMSLTSSRHQAGIIEKTLTQILADKSHWQKMLKSGNQRPNEAEFMDKLNSVHIWLKDALIKKPELIATYPPASPPSQIENVTLFHSPAIVKINYPVPENIEKIKSISLEKEKEFQGSITGIKGQYIFFGERVLNMRNHEGYIVNLELNGESYG